MKWGKKKKSEDEVPEELSEEDGAQFVDRLLKGDELIEEIDCEWGHFEMRYPLPRMIREIQVLLSTRLKGQNVPSGVRLNFEVYAVLDTVIKSGPDWWNRLESSEDCIYDDCVTYLYGRYLQFYNGVQEKIRRFQPGKAFVEDAGEDTGDSVGDEPLPGTTYRSEVSKAK